MDKVIIVNINLREERERPILKLSILFMREFDKNVLYLHKKSHIYSHIYSHIDTFAHTRIFICL